MPTFAECDFALDGDQWCCMLPNFEDAQVSPVGFGPTKEEAYNALIEEMQED